MRKYELMFIVKSELDEEASKALVAEMKGILTSNGANVVEETDLGNKELAYEIDHHKTGHYYLFVAEAEESKSIDEFERISNINENILRHLIIKK